MNNHAFISHRAGPQVIQRLFGILGAILASGLLMFPMACMAITWEFDRDDDIQGWQAYGMVGSGGGNTTDLRVVDGVLEVNVRKDYPGSGPYLHLLSPVLNADISLFDRIEVRARISNGVVIGFFKMYWWTSLSPKGSEPWMEEYTVRLYPGKTCVWTEEWQNFGAAELYQQEHWEGELLRFQLSFGFTYPGVGAQEVPDKVLIDSITLTGVGEQFLDEPVEPVRDMPSGALFERYVVYKMAYRPCSVWGGDMDGDGDLDLVSVGGDRRGEFHRLSILWNEGDRTFSEEKTYLLEYEPSCWMWGGDLDRDGDLDLMVGNFSDNSISVLLNQGGGVLLEGMVYNIGPWATVWAGDLDGDGDVDLIVANWEEEHVSVLFNEGEGTFVQPVDYAVGQHPSGVYAADLDRHADLDLVVLGCEADFGPYSPSKEYEPMPDYVYVFYNDGTGLFGDRQQVLVGDANPFGLRGDDFDGDGFVDLAVINAGELDAESNTISVLLNRGDGTFHNAVDYATGHDPTSMCTGDFDLDGDIDIAIGHRGDLEMRMLSNNGSGTFSLEGRYPISGSSNRIWAGDLDGDGDLDVVGADHSGGNLFVLVNQTVEHTTWVEEKMGGMVPVRCVLYACYPNPFNSTTLIPFDLALSGRVTLTLYDMLGRKVRTLMKGPMSPGRYTIPWDGRDDGVASGCYLYRLQAGTFSESKTMTLIK